MKKIIYTLLLAVIVPLTASAYYPYGGYGYYPDVQLDVTARAGSTVTQSTPTVGGVIGLNYMGFRGELEVGWGHFSNKQLAVKNNLCYVSPMFGYVYGYNHQIYAMAGLTNWGYHELNHSATDAVFVSNELYGKVKVGCNLFLMPKLFLNFDLSYIVPKHLDFHNLTYDGMALKAGVGYRF